MELGKFTNLEFSNTETNSADYYLFINTIDVLMRQYKSLQSIVSCKIGQKNDNDTRICYNSENSLCDKLSLLTKLLTKSPLKCGPDKKKFAEEEKKQKIIVLSPAGNNTQNDQFLRGGVLSFLVTVVIFLK